MIYNSNDLNQNSVTRLNLLRVMNLRRSLGRSCKEKSTLSCKNVNSVQRTKRPLKCRKNAIHLVKNLMKTPAKYTRKSSLHSLHTFNPPHINPVIPIHDQKTLIQAKAKQNVSQKKNTDKELSDHVSKSKKRLVTRKVSQNSLVIPVELLNKTHKCNSYVILESISSSEKKPNKTKVPILKKSKHSIKFPVSPQKQICHVQNTNSVTKNVTPLKKTSKVHKKKYSKKSIISEKGNFHVTSIPVCINSLSKHESTEISCVEQNRRKVSCSSEIILLESTANNSTQSRYDMILRSRQSLPETRNNVQVSVLGKMDCLKNFVTPQKQMVHKIGTVTESITPQNQLSSVNRIKNSRKSSTASQKQNFPLTSTPISVNLTSKYESIKQQNLKKNVFSKEMSEASPVFLLQSANETASSSRFSMTLRSRHSSKATSSIETPLVKKIKSVRKSSIPQNSSTIIDRCAMTVKQVSSKQSQKRAFKKHKSSIPSQKKSSSKCHRKSSAVTQRNTQNKYHTFSGIIPLDDLALSVGSRVRKVKSGNFKVPNKNILKRKREAIEAIKKADEGYEDDIYEPEKFEKFKELFDTSESDVPSTISTPKLGFQVTPLIRHKTPKYTDCFNPTAYAISRKIAEEYIYRNKKRKSAAKSVTPVKAEKKKLELSEILAQSSKFTNIEKSTEDSDEDDSYFSFC